MSARSGVDGRSGSEDSKLRVLIADADPLARLALTTALRHEILVVGEVASSEAAVLVARSEQPDVILIDEDLAAAAMRGMLASAPQAPIVVLSPRPTEEGGIAVLAAGASGYLDKGLDPELFARLVRGVARGEAAISRILTRRLLDELPPTGGGMSGLRPIRSGLSSRDWELIDLLRLRTPADQLAHELGLSPLALRRRLRALQARLGVDSPEEVVDTARRLCVEAVRGVSVAADDEQPQEATESPAAPAEGLQHRNAS